MKNISFGQIIVILLFGFLLFGDFSILVKNLSNFIKKYKLNEIFKKKTRKKGN